MARKKNSRMRGKTTYGYGSKKKHRGAGNRGGRGMAGSGKRAAQKKPSIIKTYGLRNYFGRHGFKSLKKKLRTINILELNILAKKGKLEKEGDFFIIELEKLGYDKLLGKGEPLYRFSVKGFVTEKASEKIIEAKGKIVEGLEKGVK